MPISIESFEEKESQSILWLVTTDKLYKKHLNVTVRLGISIKDGHCRFVYEHEERQYPYNGFNTITLLDDFPVNKCSVEELRILLAGVVLDLIRIKTDNSITYELLQELSDL